MRKSAIFDELNHFRSTRNNELEILNKSTKAKESTNTKGSVKDIVEELRNARSKSKASLEK